MNDATVSTHALDTASGRPAAGVGVELAVRGDGPDGERWSMLGTARTDTDGRCAAFPALPPAVTHVRLRFDVGQYQSAQSSGGTAFFPEVTVAFAVSPGEHHHVPLLLSPFGYSVYRGS
ncbi:hydroxyisourate hydrolase [Streptomyces hesseae]|uniref:5-hydroxyisourate hydrolase n=1 Tax=Streptomyces hesseae TaxID=3075519 RepID=A0ABU2ST83_9ACTN|nr:hydroxyisourate hydrolase [Streptomyces sp. DSM 40473]MDT0452201.1 hydroxyisourate hydrolase [Streptomyces sp. DSM 40473]